MIPTNSLYDEIVIKVSPARFTGSPTASSISTSPSKESKRAYDVLIYTQLQIAGLDRPAGPPAGQPDKIAGLPLAGRELLVVRWSRYQEYLAAFVEGDKTFSHMRSRLLETMPPGLETVFTSTPSSSKPIRVWWANDTPELEDLPWELVTYGGRSLPAGRFSLVRGLPPETPLPILPVGDRIRLAFIFDPDYTPTAIRNAMRDLPPEIELIEMPSFPRKSLEEVVKKGYELVHIVADGIISSAYEGILYFHGGRSSSPEIAPGELSAMLRGSRVSVLALSEQSGTESPDMMPIGGMMVPSVYRGFACLANTRLPLPTMIVPLGPLRDYQVTNMWGAFYKELGQSANILRAFSKTQLSGYPAPVALFLRHLSEVLFRKQAPTDPPVKTDPTQLGAALQLSQELVKQLKANVSVYGSLPESVSKFIESESVRQESLESELDPWLTPNPEEMSHE